MRRPVEEYILEKIEQEEQIKRVTIALHFAGLTRMEMAIFIGVLLGYSVQEMCRMQERDRRTINNLRKNALRKVQSWLNETYDDVPQFAETWYRENTGVA